MEIHLKNKGELEEVLNQTTDQTAFIIRFDDMDGKEHGNEIPGEQQSGS